MSASSHPHFDDRGTLRWTTRWHEAQRAAREGEKLVLVELGRRL